jgi:folate-binding protein YgfZ
MTRPLYAILPHRAVVTLAGPDVRGFLQGIVSNDVARVSTERALWTAFLTPQGKFLHEFFLVERPADATGSDGGETLFWLDCEAERRADLLRRLKIYKLRARVELGDAGDELAVAALFGPGTAAALGLDGGAPGQACEAMGGVAFLDPRLPALGARALLPRGAAEDALRAAGFAAAALDDYDRLRIGLGVPDGSRDLEVEKSLLLESGFDELNGLDWDKGCYMGQELTARTRYRGLVKKRLLPVEIDGPVPASGTPVLSGEREAGVLRSAVDGRGLALLRLERLDDNAAPLTAGEARLTVIRPDWAKF